MGIIEDAYQFGFDHAQTYSEMGLDGEIKSLQRGQDIAVKLTPEFFSDYKDYKYTKSNADIVFQIIYFGVMNRILEWLKYSVNDNFSKLKAQLFVANMFGELTGEKSAIRSEVRREGSPLHVLIHNYTISTGHAPDQDAIRQLQFVVDIGDRIARQHGATVKNINWSDVDLYLQPGMIRISDEHIREIQEDFNELFSEPTIREELKDAKAIYNDQHYNIIVAWYGGSQLTGFYKGKEIGVITLNNPPVDAKQAEYIMSHLYLTRESYPEIFANDETTYKELMSMKQKRHG